MQRRLSKLIPGQSDTVDGAVRVAAVRRTNRRLLLLVCLPLLLALAAAGSRWVYGCVERQRAADQRGERVGRFTRAEAARRAQDLVARVSGVPDGAVKAVSIEIFTNAAKRGPSPGSDEWNVLCRAATRDRDSVRGNYLVRLAADSGEPLLVRTVTEEEVVWNAGAVSEALGPTASKDADGAAGADGANRDLRRRGDTVGTSDTVVISHREASLWARRYLSAVGLPLPVDARLVRDRGYDFTYRCSGPKGMRRLLRVRVRPKDGRLEHLMNVVHSKFAPLPSGRKDMPRVEGG